MTELTGRTTLNDMHNTMYRLSCAYDVDKWRRFDVVIALPPSYMERG